MGQATEILKREYGGLIQEREAEFVTGAGFQQALQNDPDAVAVTFVNFGAFDIFLALRQTAPASSGVRLVPNGGSVSLTLRDDLTLPAHEWFAASPGGASSLYSLRLRVEVLAGG